MLIEILNGFLALSFLAILLIGVGLVLFLPLIGILALYIEHLNEGNLPDWMKKESYIAQKGDTND